nr:AIF_HP1_G0030810.mRNA.1.CDS.1 [Saccharomyces cerevisiae]
MNLILIVTAYVVLVLVREIFIQGALPLVKKISAVIIIEGSTDLGRFSLRCVRCFTSIPNRSSLLGPVVTASAVESVYWWMLVSDCLHHRQDIRVHEQVSQFQLVDTGNSRLHLSCVVHETFQLLNVNNDIEMVETDEGVSVSGICHLLQTVSANHFFKRRYFDGKL